MAKLTLTDVTSGFASASAVNANGNAIELAFENTLSRDGAGPNYMLANIDMNGFSLLNLGNPLTVSGLNWEGPWATSTLYTVGDIVESNGSAYITIEEHTSGIFATDLSANKWQLFASASFPDQTGHGGKVLTTNGSSVTWDEVDATGVTYTSPKTGAVEVTLDDRLATTLNVADFGAVGDGVTNDTIAIQKALDALVAGQSLEFVSGKTYAVTNLNIPNTTNDWNRNRVFSSGMATIKRISGGDTSYMVATERWLTASVNKTFASSPFTWQNIIFDANNLCDYAVVNKSYGSEFLHCRFDNALVDGCLFTRKNQDATLGTTDYLANTKFISCDGGGNVGYWLRTQGPVTDNTDAPTDGHIIECQPDCGGGAGCIYLANAGGWTVRGNHTFAYSGAAATNAELYIASLSKSGPIADNSFEGLVRIGKISNEAGLIGPGNNFWEGVRVDFTNDTSDEIVSIIGNTFTKTVSGVNATIVHANNRAVKTIVSNNTFESTTPHVYASGVTLGTFIILNRVVGDLIATNREAVASFYFNKDCTIGSMWGDFRATAASGYRDVRAISGSNIVGLGVDNNNGYVSTFNNMPLKLQVNATDRIEMTTGGLIKMYGVPDYADDAAATAGGVPVSGIYRTGSTLKIRVA